MSFRNDLEAANARIDSLEREKRELAEQNARLNARLRTPTAVEPERKPWPLMNLRAKAPKRKPDDRDWEWRWVVRFIGNLFGW